MRLIFVLMAIAFSQLCYGFSITGRVVDQSGKAIEGARCDAIYRDSIISGSLSDDIGKFLIQNEMPASPDSLKISISNDICDSYEIMLYNPIDSVDLGDCILNDYTYLDEFTVVANPVVKAKGKLIYTPSKSQIEISPRAIDLVGNVSIPGLVYNTFDKSFSITGRTPVILIDGRYTDQRELKSIRSSDVASIEFSDIVPTIYSEFGDCLISVRLKKRPAGGTFYIENLNDFRGCLETCLLDFTYNKGASKTRISADYRLQRDPKTFDTQWQRYNVDDNSLDICNDANIRTKSKRINTVLEYSYNPDPSLLFVGKLSLFLFNSLSKDSSEVFDSSMGNYSSFRRNHWNNVRPNIDIYFSKAFNSKNVLDLNVMLRMFGHMDYTSDISYFYPDDTQTIPYSLSTYRKSVISAINYKYKFSENADLSVTYQNTLSWNKNSYHVDQTTSRLKENNNYAYLTYQQSINNIWFSLRTGINQRLVNDEGKVNNSICNISQINASWKISQSFNLDYRGIYTPVSPTLADLLDVPVTISNHLVETGNPDLKTAVDLNQSLSLNFSKGKCRASVSFANKHMFNPILYSMDYNASDKYFLKTTDNGRYTDHLRVSFDGGFYGLFDMFTFQGSIGFNSYKTACNDWACRINSLEGWFGVAWQYKKWSVLYTRGFQPKKFIGFESVKDSGFDTLAVRFTPNEHWSFSLAWDYMFNKHGYTTSTEYIGPFITGERVSDLRHYSNMISLNISYDISFGNIFKPSKSKSIELEDTQTTFRRIDN